MNIFESPFSKNTCGLLDIPDGKSGGIQLMMVDKNDQSCNVKLLHTKETTVEAGTSFTTVSEKVSCSLSVNKFILYLDQPSSYSWILENSITINIYNFRTNVLLATKVIGKQDSLVRLGTSKYKDKPSIVINQCNSNIDFDLEGNFVKIEMISMCDRNSSPCCDSLPTQVSVSGYDNLCIPMNDFYIVPNYPSPTTTAQPYSLPPPTVSLLDDLSVKESSGIPYYIVDAHVSTSDGSEFSYWWERSEDNTSWYRITDLRTEATETLLALKEVKTRDYYYRLYFDSPQKIRSNIAFYDYPEIVTTSTTTTTPSPLEHPNSPIGLQASGGGFRQVHLDWSHAAVDDERAPRTGYSVFANTSSSTDSYDTFIFGTGLAASTTGYFQPVPASYDGIELHYCLYSENFFGRSDPTCAAATTVSNEPPTVSNLVVTPDDTGGVEGFFLDWVTTGANETYPLVSHRIQYRTSGTADAYSVINYPVADLSVTQVKVTGVFADCQNIEFLVDAESTIGMSAIPATGYAKYGFLPHSPTNLSLELEEDSSTGEYSIDLGWTEPTDSGRCELSGYVYNYRLAGALDWSANVVLSTVEIDGVPPAITPLTTNPNTFSIQTNTVPSGDYEARVAAITEVGTGIYGAISAATLVKLDFEEWIQNTGVNRDHLYSIPNTSAYTSWAHIDTYPTSVSADGGDALYGRSAAAKFGNFGLYGGSESFNNGNAYFTCPAMGHVDQGENINKIYPYKVGYVAFNGLVDMWSEQQTGAQGSIASPYYKSLTNSSTPLNLDGDGETRYTFETWFKLNAIDTTWTNANLSISDVSLLSLVTVPDSKFFNTTNFPSLSENCGGGFDGTGANPLQEGFDEWLGSQGGATYAYLLLKGDFILGSGLRLKVQQRIGSRYGNNAGDNIETWTAGDSMEILAPHPNYIDDTEWHHIAIVGSGNNMKLYVDGTGIMDHDMQHYINIQYANGDPDIIIAATGFDHTSQFGYLVFNQTQDNIAAIGGGPDGEENIDGYCNYFDEIRLTNTVAYSGNFDVPTEPLA